MDLGIAGKKALVCAASKGLGRGCALALARNGAQVTITARTKDALEAAAAEIARQRAAARSRRWSATSPRPKDGPRALAACPAPDILVNNAGGPPPGDFRDWDEDDWLSACNANMITAIMLIKATVDGMIGRRFGRIVNITSSSVKAPIPQLGLSNGARAGPDRLRRRDRPPDRRAQRHDQQHPARALRRPTGCARAWRSRRRSPAGRSPRSRPRRAPRSRPGGSARPRSSASCAPSSAAPRRATSPARIS